MSGISYLYMCRKSFSGCNNTASSVWSQSPTSILGIQPVRQKIKIKNGGKDNGFPKRIVSKSAQKMTGWHTALKLNGIHERIFKMFEVVLSFQCEQQRLCSVFHSILNWFKKINWQIFSQSCHWCLYSVSDSCQFKFAILFWHQCKSYS